MCFLNSDKTGAPYGITILGILLVGLLAFPGVCDADPFSFFGNGNYRESGGDNVETSDRFNQSYSLTFDKQLSSMMDMSASTRYNEAHLSEGDDSSSLNPSASLDLSNDLFSLNLSGSESWLEMENSPDYDNKTWGANLYSQLEKWPGLRLSYNQSSNRDDLHVHEQDSESSTFGASVDYAVAGFNLLYDFRYGNSDDQVTDVTTDTLNHYAQVRYSESFFQNRLSIGASQQYSSNETETDSPVGADGVFMQPITILAGLSSTDNSPLFGTLSDNSQLVDGDQQTSAGIEVAQNDDGQNIGAQVDFQRVNRLRIYLHRQLTPAEQSALSWELYQSANNNVWTGVNQSFTPVFSRVIAGQNIVTRVTIDVPTPLMVRYLKVVTRSATNALSPVFVTEVEAGELRTTDASRVVSTNKFVSHQTQFSVSYRPATNWITGYNFRRVLNLPDGGLDNTQVTHSVNAAYSPSVYFSLALGASENWDDIEGAEDSLSRSYSVAVSSSPLPTLDTSLSYTRTHDYEDGDETTQNDFINGNLAAEVYPDLTVSFSPFWSRNRDLDSEAKTTTHGFTLNSNARLTPRLDLTGYWNYARSDAETEEEEEEAFDTMSRQYGATLSYRPSDVLLVSGGLRRDQEEDSTSLSGTMTWLLTRNIQANGGVSFGLGEDDSDNYNASVNWMISRNLSLQGGGNYQVAEAGDTWGAATSLNINY